MDSFDKEMEELAEINRRFVKSTKELNEAVDFMLREDRMMKEDWPLYVDDVILVGGFYAN